MRSKTSPRDGLQTERARILTLRTTNSSIRWPDFNGELRFDDGSEIGFFADIPEIESGLKYDIVFEFVKGPLGSPMVKIRDLTRVGST